MILRETNRAVRMYEGLSKKSGIKNVGRVINVAGRQRMLTQKMGLEACLVALDFRPFKWAKSMKGTKKLFEKSLNALIHGNEKMKIPAPSNPATKTQLLKVASLWGNYSELLATVAVKGVGGPEKLAELAKSSQIILTEMNKAVTLLAETKTQSASVD